MGNFIKLSGHNELISTENFEYYRVISGSALIFLSKVDSNRLHGRKFYIDEVNCKDNINIPAIYSRNPVEEKAWCTVISPLNEVVIEVLDADNIDGICRAYGKRFSLNVDNQVELEDELIEGIERKIFTEEVRVYKNLEEERKNLNRSLNGIYNFFYKDKGMQVNANSPSNLYNSVEFLCKKNKIAIVPYEKLIENCGRTFKLSDISRMSGFMIREVYLEENWYKNNSGSILAYKLEEADECIPIACYWNNNIYNEYDFQSNSYRKIDSKLNDSYIKNAYMIYKPLPNKKLTFVDLIKFTTSTLKLKDIVSIIILSLIIMVIQLIIPVLYETLYNTYIPMGLSNALVQLGLLAFAMGISNIFFTIYKGYVQFKTTICMELTLQNAVYNRLFNLKGHVYKDYECADLVRRTVSITGIIRRLASSILSSFLPLILSFVYIVFMNRYSSEYTKIGVLYVFAEFMIILLLGLKQVKYSNELVELKTESSSFLYQLLGGIEKIRIAGREDVAASNYYDIYIKIRNLTKKKFEYKNIGNCIKSLMSALFVIIIYFQVVKSNNNLRLGTLLSFIAIYSIFSNTVLQICDEVINVGELLPEIKRNKIFFDEFDEQSGNNGNVIRITGEIELNNVCFSYSNSQENILNNLSMKIKNGEYIGIVGPSGSGKSTLLNLLLGFNKPSSGKIYYDNKDIDLLDKIELRRQLGVVLQNGDLIAGSIYENIAISSSEVTKEEAKQEYKRVNQVVKYVGLEEDIKAMPMGLQTIISEGSGGISGGQKQRILIARAIFNNPKILLFDEATSALDNISQQVVCDNLEKLNATRIVIAHRLSTVKKCDKIFVLNDGEIIESGSYDELINKKGYFYELVQRQIA